MLDPGDREDVEAVRAALAAKHEKSSRGWGHAIALLVVTLVLFWSQQQVLADQAGSWVAALVIVLAIHEGGHWLAMRAFGYTDLKVFFIPFLGAAASGRKRDATATQKALVSLFGPLPGIVLALAALPFAPFDSPLLANLVVLALFLNAFNLLPLLPLDAGRYLDVTLFARWPILRQVVTQLSGVALAVFGWQREAWVLLALGVFVFLGAGASRIHARGAAVLREQLEPDELLSLDIPDRLIPNAMDCANQLVFGRSSVSATPERYANVLVGFWEHVRHRPPSPGRTAALLLVYLGSVGLAFAAFVLLGLVSG